MVWEMSSCGLAPGEGLGHTSSTGRPGNDWFVVQAPQTPNPSDIMLVLGSGLITGTRLFPPPSTPPGLRHPSPPRGLITAVTVETDPHGKPT